MRHMMLRVMHHGMRYMLLCDGAAQPLGESNSSRHRIPSANTTARTRLHDPEWQIEMLRERRLRPAGRRGAVQRAELMAEQLHLCPMPSHSRGALGRTWPGFWRLVIWSMLRMLALPTVTRCGAHAATARSREPRSNLPRTRGEVSHQPVLKARKGGTRRVAQGVHYSARCVLPRGQLNTHFYYNVCATLTDRVVQQLAGVVVRI